MRNIQTLNDLNNAPVVNTDPNNDGISYVLNLMGTDNTSARSALDRFLDEHQNFIREHGGSSSMSESFPNLYSNSSNVNSDTEIENIFSILKNIFKKLMNNEIEIESIDSNTLTTLIQKEASEANVDVKLLTELNSVVEDYQSSITDVISTFKPLGSAGDITVNELLSKLIEINGILDPVISVQPLHLISFGIVYRLLSKTFIKHFDGKTDIPKISDPNLKLKLLRLRGINLGIVLGGIIPFSTLLITNFSNVSFFNTLQVKISSLNNSSNSILLPLYTNLKLFKGKNTLSYFTQLKNQLNNKLFKLLFILLSIYLFCIILN